MTFLFTDIEGSTTLWEQFPEAMRLALGHHDAILRNAIESSDGHIVKATGDGVYAVFGTAKDALVACIAGQRALQALAGGILNPESAASNTGLPIALSVRMGMHSGAAELRDGDYFGTSLNRAARIMSAAHGEQVLLSATTAELVRGQLPDDISLREMGEHRLKGLLNPERLLQVVAPGLRTNFPPLASQTGHSLPAERDTFVGRQDALAELARRFDSGARLVSVLGIGGTGKTRLVIRFGWTVLEKFPGGVWFCDLAQARGVDGILHAVAQGLDVPLGKEDPVAQLGHAIAGRKRCLVILDNFEQVARDADKTLDRWLSRSPSAQFLVTTQEVLGLAGEEIVGLAPLALQDASELFMRRAEAAKPGFEPNTEDRSAIPLLVKLLDGLPLAVELAAARVRVMPPRTLLARMSERFKLLSSAGGRVDRQATLRGVFDWSWGLLTLPEKAALAQLSVFQGGFALEAVEAVLDFSPSDDAPWPVDVLQSLVQKSLVRQVADDRFDLLVSVQEYAAEHLGTDLRFEGSGAAARLAAEARHGAYFAALDEQAATANACAELDNLVAACRRAVARGDAEMAAKALEGAWAGLKQRGPFRAGVDLVSIVEATPGLGPAATARVNGVAGSALEACGKLSDACVRFEASLAMARAVGDRDCECRALIGLSFLGGTECSPNAGRANLEAALAIATELNNRTLQINARNSLGNLESAQDLWDKARAHYEHALTLAKEAGDRPFEGRVLGNLGQQYGRLGIPDKVRSYTEEALVVAREVGDRKLEGNTLSNFGLWHFLQGRLAEAQDHLETALAVARDIGHITLECIVLCNLGIVQESLDELDDARNHLKLALDIARETGHRRSEGQVLGYMGLVHARRAEFAEARHCLDAGEALLRAVFDTESLGIIFSIRAETEQLAGDTDAARTALSAAEVNAAEVSAGAESELGHALARARKYVAQRGPSRNERWS